MVEELKGKLSKREMGKRQQQFDDLQRFIKNSAKSGGLNSPIFRSFNNPHYRDRTRVDFELWAGAFGLSLIIFLLIVFL